MKNETPDVAGRILQGLAVIALTVMAVLTSTADQEIPLIAWVFVGGVAIGANPDFIANWFGKK